MKLIVGLGNPGKLYVASRHNIGFLAVEALAKNFSVKLKRPFGSRYLNARLRIGDEPVMLAEPLTYMNLSGAVVSALVKKNKIALSDVLVVCDDMDLELGRLKLRPSGSSGGHRGIQSIIDCLSSNEFSRLRIGIGRPGKNEDPAEYVLSVFKRQEKEAVVENIQRACACIEAWAAEGIEKTMNTYNKKENV